MFGKILPKNTLTNHLDMMYRDLAHEPTANHNISCLGTQASVHGIWELSSIPGKAHHESPEAQ